MTKQPRQSRKISPEDTNRRAKAIVTHCWHASVAGSFVVSYKNITAAYGIPPSTTQLYFSWMMKLGWIVGSAKSKLSKKTYHWGVNLDDVRRWIKVEGQFPNFHSLTAGFREELNKRIALSKKNSQGKGAARKKRQPVSGTVFSNVSHTIVWSQEEREKIAEEFALLRMDDPFSSSTVLYQAAQNRVLSSERVRKDKHLIAESQEFRKLVKEKYVALFEDVKFEPVIIERTLPPPPPPDPLSLVATIPLAKLCALAVERLLTEQISPLPLWTGIVAPAPSAAITPVPSEAPAPAAAKPIPFPPTTAKEAKLRIAVITHLETNRQVIREKVPKDVELIFIDRNKGPKHTGVPKTADYLIAHRTSHGWRWMLDNFAPGKDRAIFLKDGINGVISKIMELRSCFIATHNTVRLEKAQ